MSKKLTMHKIISKLFVKKSYDDSVVVYNLNNFDEREIYDNTVFTKERYKRFKLVEDQENTTQIRINGRLLNAVRKVYYEEIPFVLKEHNIDFDSLVDTAWETKLEDLEKWNNLRNDYSELIDWQNELKNISDGYENIYENELVAILEQVNEIIDSISLSLSRIIEKQYFSYEKSTIQDLSLVNGITHYLFFNGTERIVKCDYILNRLGGVFLISNNPRTRMNKFSRSIHL